MSRPDGKPSETEAADTARARQKANGEQMFFIFYFTITGVHALHMIVGLGVLAVQLVMARRYPSPM